MSNISINNAIPENALERQLYFIEKCKEHVAQLKKELNRPLLCCTQTFERPDECKRFRKTSGNP